MNLNKKVKNNETNFGLVCFWIVYHCKQLYNEVKPSGTINSKKLFFMTNSSLAEAFADGMFRYIYNFILKNNYKYR